MDRERQPAMRPASRGTRRTDGRARDVDPREAREPGRGSSRTARSSRSSANEPRRRASRDDRDRDRRDARAERDDDWLDERTGGIRALLHGFAVVRWILLIFAVGFGIAAVVAIALAALFALVNASV